MAVKILKDKIIHVRATEGDVKFLDALCKELNLNKSDVISLALKTLYKSDRK